MKFALLGRKNLHEGVFEDAQLHALIPASETDSCLAKLRRAHSVLVIKWGIRRKKLPDNAVIEFSLDDAVPPLHCGDLCFVTTPREVGQVLVEEKYKS